MTVTAAALQIILATCSNGCKEALSHLGYLPPIPALPGTVLAFISPKTQARIMLIPTFGQQLLIIHNMRSEPLSPPFVSILAASATLVGVPLVLATIRLYQCEQVLFAR